MDGIASFGSFELNLRTGELRKCGIRMRLRRQSGEILAMVLERPGEVVTREEIRNRLWPDGTVVEFEHSVNSAVNRLRDVLGDSAAQPRYIETLAKVGYRFVGTVAVSHRTPPLPTAADTPQAPPAVVPGGGIGYWKFAFAAAVVLAMAIGVWMVAGRTRPAPVTVRSIAILPLTNLSRDPDQEYFADGMTEALTSDLARLDTVRVISRTSAMTYKGSRKPLREIAKELNVDAVVEGSVLRSGGRVRIVAQLIQAATDTHLWSGTYERQIEEVLRLQGEVARAIAAEVRAALMPGPLSGRAAVKPEAYELYLKGMFQLNRYTPEGFEKGIAYLKQAIERDPANPFPHAALALGYAMVGHEGYPEALTLVKPAAQKSLELGGPVAEAYAALGMMEMYSDWDVENGARDLQRALELNPNFAEARRNYSWYLRLKGQTEAAIGELKQAESLDPLQPQISSDLAWQYLLDGNYGAALSEVHKALEVNPSFSQALAVMGWVYTAQGKAAEAIAVQEKASRGDNPWKWPLGRTLAVLGRRAEARSVAAEIARKPRPIEQWGLGAAYAALGDKDKAFHWLDEAYRSRFSWMPWVDGMKSVPEQDLFGALRDDPRFAELMRRVNDPKNRP